MPRKGQYTSLSHWSEPDATKIARLEAELEHIKMAAIIKPMVDQFAHNLALMLVHGKPFKEWTHTERAALDNAFGNATVARQWFLSTLPGAGK